jgi:hypothetical protein
VKTRLEIEREIDSGKQKLDHYHKIIEENKERLTQKVFKVLQENHYIDQNAEPPKKERNEDSSEPKYKMRTKREAVEYKWAFGQKIPIEYDWKVRQSKQNERKNSQLKSSRRSTLFMCD